MEDILRTRPGKAVSVTPPALGRRVVALAYTDSAMMQQRGLRGRCRHSKRNK
jgi:hypothetical protein